MADGASRPKAAAMRAVSLVFRRYGYEGTTMSRLSENTGLGRSSLYHHFRRGKEDMARESLALVDQLFDEQLFPLLDGNDPPSERLQRFATRLGAYYEGGRVGCLLGAFSLQDSPPAVSEYVRTLFDRWINALQAIYVEMGLSPELARKRAGQSVAAIQGSLLLSAATGDEGHLADALGLMCEVGERP